MDDLNNIYLVTSIVLSVLLIISELMGWSKCEPNAISQWLYKTFCVIRVKRPVGEIVQFRQIDETLVDPPLVVDPTTPSIKRSRSHLKCGFHF